MHGHLQADPRVQLLETIPGIGPVLAHVIQAEIGQIERFPDYRHLTSYAGLAPLSNDSADRHGRRHCSPACNHTLRWAFIEAAGGAVRSRHSEGTHLRRLYQRLSRPQQLKNTAKVAVARELVKLVYIVWKKKRPYLADPPARPGQSRAAQPQEPSPTSLRSDQPRHPMVRRGQKAAARPICN
jgi:transposase